MEKFLMPFKSISNLCRQALKDGLFCSCAVAISKDGGTEYLTFNCEQDSIFDCASITKSMPTAYLALKLIESGQLSLKTPIAKILPEFTARCASEPTVEATIFNLLTHSLDYRFPMSSLKDLSAEEIWGKICSHKFEIPPGRFFNYANANSILLGKIVEAVCNNSASDFGIDACGNKLALDEIAKKEVFIPLKMNSTGWFPLKWANPDRIIPTEICSWRKREIKGETHDESAWKLEQKFGAVGSAGVFSTASDIVKFLNNILFPYNNDAVENRQDNPNFILDCLTKNALAYLNNPAICAALGFELNNPKFMGNAAKKNGEILFGKTGFTGTSFVCRPADRLSVVILSNYTYPHRKPNANGINKFRSQIADLIF